jgi:hypothetical protein
MLNLLKKKKKKKKKKRRFAVVTKKMCKKTIAVCMIRKTLKDNIKRVRRSFIDIMNINKVVENYQLGLK